MKRGERNRETLIALRATHAAHRLATAVMLSRITDLDTTACLVCGHAFVSGPGAEGLAAGVCQACRDAPELALSSAPPPASRAPQVWHQGLGAVFRRWLEDVDDRRRGA